MRLSRDIRYQISALLVAGHQQKVIAKLVEISEGGLSKEISRNGGRKKYDPDKADKRAVRLQHKAHIHYEYSDEVWAEKSRFGDFEIDLINGAHHKGNLLTANDRMSMFCILEPLPTKDATALADALIAAFSLYKKLLHTVTSDNGKEFADHARIAQRLNVGYYFAHPYHSWERGANENMNGLIRQYLPKGTSFENLTREKVKWIEWKLNNRPRKRLGFLTPLEYISRQLKQIYLAT